MGWCRPVGVGGVKVRGRGTCFGARVVVFGADIFGRALTDFEGDRAGVGDPGERGLLGESEVGEKARNLDGERGRLLGLVPRRKVDRKSMLGERTDSASRNALVRPSPE